MASRTGEGHRYSFGVYILYSPSLERYYVGHAEDPVLRSERDHNGGRNTSTKAGRPWEHRWVKWFNTRAEAMAMEAPSRPVRAGPTLSP
ncbi:MAG: GIY-YIG nuclease family protein [Flavobacteriales bacterium]|nr:GIY-YIG nuclease family protein [Flavobacteriales bacterium]